MVRQAVIIGAGIGGLATAIRLQHAGWQVTIAEKNARPGGRCNVVREQGFTFDTGPTLLLMRDVLDDLFATVGHSLADYLELAPITPNYRIHFADGSDLTLSSDIRRVEVEIEHIEPGGAVAFRRYLADAGYKYRIARQQFVERNFRHWGEFATATNLYYLFKTNTLRKLDAHARRYFRDPRLIAAFTFQTMYLGLAPSDAPAVYSLLPYTEMMEGIWFPAGGMYRIVEALHRLALQMGVRVLTGTEVVQLDLHARTVHAIELADGRQLRADVVISNADLPYSYAKLMPKSRRGRFTDRTLRRLEYGSSAYLLYLGLDREYPQLHHHEVFLSANVNANFASIFRDQRLPADPSFYLCAASRTDRSMAPEGCESLYVLVPVPHAGGSVDWEAEGPAFRETILQRLEASGLDDLRQHVVMEHSFTPRDFTSEYNIAHGSAFGLSHGFRQVGYMRPANKANDLDNLYFVGASTVPGGGVPMVILGSRLVTERIYEDLGHA